MNSPSNKEEKDLKSLDEKIAEIIVDAYGDDEQLWAFRQVIEDDLDLPVDGFVIGEPVVVLEIDYDGNERRGLTARCRREDGSDHIVAASEVVFPTGSSSAWLIAAYRKWLNLVPFPVGAMASSERKRQHKATADDLDLSQPVDLIVLSVKERALRCRIPGSARSITLRPSLLGDAVPGEIVTVKPRKQWSYGGYPYLPGEIQSTRLEVKALNLLPLNLEEIGMWDPQEHYWGEENDIIEPWAEPIIAKGPRPSFEMEQILPGQNIDDLFVDPITRANDLKDAGEYKEAIKTLMDLCQADLRCLDAHSHLGNCVFDHSPKVALRHYEAGLRIGELSLGKDFTAVLKWGRINNRPFLRCMHGYGLCLWRLERFDEALSIFHRMLWLNPSDNQGARFLLEFVQTHTPWEVCQDGWH